MRSKPLSPQIGNTVFISYSRKDQSFVRQLNAALQRANRDPWVDWDDIRKGEEWWSAIRKGIESAHTFIFVISPDSVASVVCRDEINYAMTCNKRFLPIVYREGFDRQQVHPKVSSHNWLFFRDTDNFDSAFQELLTALDTDLEYVHAHTRLLVRALEWEDKACNPSYLLRGADLANAEQWLRQGAAKEPSITDLQTQFINTSLDAETARFRAALKARRTVILTTVLANLALAVAGGIWFYREQQQEAVNNIRTDMVQALHMGILGTNGDEFAALSQRVSPNGSPPIANPLYQKHQQWLAAIRAVFPSTVTRTYVKDDAGQVRWVGDLSRDLPGTLKYSKFLAPFRPHYSQTDAFQGEVIIMKPYTDPLGRWISASGPIKNSAGQTVGGMTVYYTETYLIDRENHVIQTLSIAYVLILVWLLVLSSLILRSIQPLNERSTLPLQTAHKR